MNIWYSTNDVISHSKFFSFSNISVQFSEFLFCCHFNNCIERYLITTDICRLRIKVQFHEIIPENPAPIMMLLHPGWRSKIYRSSGVICNEQITLTRSTYIIHAIAFEAYTIVGNCGNMSILAGSETYFTVYSEKLIHATGLDIYDHIFQYLTVVFTLAVTFLSIK